MRLMRELRPAGLAAAPLAGAILTLAAGVMLVVSAATPSVPNRFLLLAELAPGILIELSHFLSSVLGLILIFLAFGLRARLDAAWIATMVALGVSLPLTLLKGIVWEETAWLGALMLFLAPFRAAFSREARLLRMEITPGWLVSAAALVVGAGLLGMWS